MGEPFLTWLLMGTCADGFGALRDKGNSDKGHVCLLAPARACSWGKLRLKQESGGRGHLGRGRRRSGLQASPRPRQLLLPCLCPDPEIAVNICGDFASPKVILKVKWDRGQEVVGKTPGI